ncbi:hypothetical protein FRX31_012636 [Thalictrum thalictroides]|uniref:Uncharacterized protein n=1 Tax=Thalictrum thalictroides TaxID=46969 RepID=A0A7J6WK52_THATH|nr:hypothetical protein FRX31_012636 [Thalictrum thalictroides]
MKNKTRTVNVQILQFEWEDITTAINQRSDALKKIERRETVVLRLRFGLMEERIGFHELRDRSKTDLLS